MCSEKLIEIHAQSSSWGYSPSKIINILKQVSIMSNKPGIHWFEANMSQRKYACNCIKWYFTNCDQMQSIPIYDVFFKPPSQIWPKQFSILTVSLSHSEINTPASDDRWQFPIHTMLLLTYKQHESLKTHYIPESSKYYTFIVSRHPNSRSRF